MKNKTGKHKTFRYFDFYKHEGMWNFTANMKTANYFYMTHGFPPEMFIEELNNMDRKRFNKKLMYDWFHFAKENNIKIKNSKKESKIFNKFLEKQHEA